MSDIQVPPQFSGTLGFGAALRYFPVKKASKWGSLIGAAIFLSGAAVAVVYGAVATFSKYNQFGPAILNRTFSSTLFPALITGVILFILGILAAWNAYKNWKKGAVVYQNGFGLSERKGVQFWRWEEIAGMTAAVTRHYRSGVYIGTTHLYTLWNRKGDRLMLNDTLQKVEELADQIRRGIYPHLYKTCAESYNQGNPVNFGPVTIHKTEGVQIKKKKYRWDEISQVTVRKGTLQIAKKEGGWFSGASVPVSTIHNLDVLLSIIDQIVGIKAG